MRLPRPLNDNRPVHREYPTWYVLILCAMQSAYIEELDNLPQELMATAMQEIAALNFAINELDKFYGGKDIDGGPYAV